MNTSYCRNRILYISYEYIYDISTNTKIYSPSFIICLIALFRYANFFFICQRTCGSISSIVTKALICQHLTHDQTIIFLSFVWKMLRNSINTTEYYTLWWSICTEIFFILNLRYVFINMFVLIFCMPALLIFNWCDVIFIVAQIRLLE